MKLSTVKRKRPFSTSRFVTTSVVSESSFPYDTQNNCLDTPPKGSDFWENVVAKEPTYEADKESVVVVLLNCRLVPYAWHVVSVGLLNESHVHPREVLRPCLAGGAYGFIMMHNHPSGDPSPSKADEAVTRRLVEASGLMQIRMLDHLIIGKPAPGRERYYSFREAGLIS